MAIVSPSTNPLMVCPPYLPGLLRTGTSDNPVTCIPQGFPFVVDKIARQ